eukprot:m.69010 g.69010  ORF g.69010 m.69010 type:complete len:96 (-) comp14103_c0_seq3:53-340(-)
MCLAMSSSCLLDACKTVVPSGILVVIASPVVDDADGVVVGAGVEMLPLAIEEVDDGVVVGVVLMPRQNYSDAKNLHTSCSKQVVITLQTVLEDDR